VKISEAMSGDRSRAYMLNDHKNSSIVDPKPKRKGTRSTKSPTDVAEASDSENVRVDEHI
jgi:hypothetical protein